jgi:hypothetical protein
VIGWAANVSRKCLEAATSTEQVPRADASAFHAPRVSSNMPGTGTGGCTLVTSTDSWFEYSGFLSWVHCSSSQFDRIAVNGTQVDSWICLASSSPTAEGQITSSKQTPPLRSRTRLSCAHIASTLPMAQAST